MRCTCSHIENEADAGFALLTSKKAVKTLYFKQHSLNFPVFVSPKCYHFLPAVSLCVSLLLSVCLRGYISVI